MQNVATSPLQRLKTLPKPVVYATTGTAGALLVLLLLWAVFAMATGNAARNAAAQADAAAREGQIATAAQSFGDTSKATSPYDLFGAYDTVVQIESADSKKLRTLSIRREFDSVCFDSRERLGVRKCLTFDELAAIAFAGGF